MSCGHQDCACGHDRAGTEQDALPRHRAGDAGRGDSGCCGGHGHDRQHDTESVGRRDAG